MVEQHTMHFTVGFSSFVDAASSSRQIAVVTLMLTVRDMQNLIYFNFKFLLDHKNEKK